MPYPNEHSARLLDPDAPHDGVASKVLAPGVRAILFIKDGRSEVQALRFDKDRFTPEEARKWCEEHGFRILSFEPARSAEGNKAHEAILHTLDRWIVTPEGERVFVPAKEFAMTVDAWDGMPVIYGEGDHPDPFQLIDDMQAALDDVGAKLVGALAAPRVAMEGNPRFVGQIDWGQDREVQARYARGELSASIAYVHSGRGEDGIVHGPVIPNHVMLFPMTDGSLPRDPGVFILNKSDVKMEAGEGAEALGMLDRLRAMVMRRAPAGASSAGAAGDGVEEMSEEEKQRLASASKELEEYKAKLASKDAEVKGLGEAMKAKEAEVARLQEELKGFHKRAADEKWAAIRAKCPPGLVHGEKEAEMRSLFESNKDAFYDRLLAFKQAPPGKEEGAQFMVRGAKDEATVDAELMKYATSVDIQRK